MYALIVKPNKQLICCITGSDAVSDYYDDSQIKLLNQLQWQTEKASLTMGGASPIATGRAKPPVPHECLMVMTGNAVIETIPDDSVIFFLPDFSGTNSPGVTAKDYGDFVVLEFDATMFDKFQKACKISKSKLRASDGLLPVPNFGIGDPTVETSTDNSLGDILACKSQMHEIPEDFYFLTPSETVYTTARILGARCKLIQNTMGEITLTSGDKAKISASSKYPSKYLPGVKGDTIGYVFAPDANEIKFIPMFTDRDTLRENTSFRFYPDVMLNLIKNNGARYLKDLDTTSAIGTVARSIANSVTKSGMSTADMSGVIGDYIDKSDFFSFTDISWDTGIITAKLDTRNNDVVLLCAAEFTGTRAQQDDFIGFIPIKGNIGLATIGFYYESKRDLLAKLQEQHMISM